MRGVSDGIERGRRTKREECTVLYYGTTEISSVEFSSDSCAMEAYSSWDSGCYWSCSDLGNFGGGCGLGFLRWSGG